MNFYHLSLILRINYRAIYFLFVFCFFYFELHANVIYPLKPINIIVPFAPGGGGDIIIRSLGQLLSNEIKQSIIVENRAGSGGNIGTNFVAKSNPDGYTLLMGNVAPIAINPSLYSQIPYDPIKDFAPITLLATFPNVLVVNSGLNIRDLNQLINLAKSKPGELSFASAGSGSTTHLAAELLSSMSSIKMLHIPYKGGGPALADLLGGHVSMYFSSLPAALPFIKSGKIIPLGITSAKRSMTSSYIPTIAENGFPGFEADTWIGLLAPAGTNDQVIDKLYKAISHVMDGDIMKDRLLVNGAEPLNSTPEQFSAFIRSETIKWSKIIKNSGIKAE